jgi:uncharacterized protein YndB with AHSA1/START domain
MESKDFTATFMVDQTPKEVFEAINNVRGWWTGDIEGNTDHLNDEFSYRYEDIHYSKHKVTAHVPYKKVEWLVTDSQLNFVDDKTEWTGTTQSFEISEKDGKTQVRFTHHGLTPDFQCFDGCSRGWTYYFSNSLPAFIVEGKTKQATDNQDFNTTITVEKSPKEAFDAITNPRGWWSEEIEGGTAKVNDEFTYHYRDVHRCTMRLTEVVPNKKVVWEVLDNDFNFIDDKSEWIGNTIIFEISEKDGKTQINFTQEGLVPAYECYDICQNAWSGYVQKSLYNLITTGQGQPNAKEN